MNRFRSRINTSRMHLATRAAEQVVIEAATGWIVPAVRTTAGHGGWGGPPCQGGFCGDSCYKFADGS